jgi:hypothetical protein
MLLRHSSSEESRTHAGIAKTVSATPNDVSLCAENAQFNAARTSSIVGL